MKKNILLIICVALIAVLIFMLTSKKLSPPETTEDTASEDTSPYLESGELDISGTWYGYETYTTPNTNTDAVPDTVSFPWEWTFERTSPYTYNVHFYHPSVEGSGSIEATPEYDIGVERMKLVDNRYMGVQNYVQVYFEERGDLLMAHGYFNMIKSTGETDVRSVVLTRDDSKKDSD